MSHFRLALTALAAAGCVTGCVEPVQQVLPVDPVSTPPPTPDDLVLAPAVELSTDGTTHCTLHEDGEARCLRPWTAGYAPPLDYDPELPVPDGPLTAVYPWGQCGLQAGAIVCPESELSAEDRAVLTGHPNELSAAWTAFGEVGSFAVGIDAATGDLSAWGDRPAYLPAEVLGPFTAVDVGRSTICALGEARVQCWSEQPGVEENAPQGAFAQVAVAGDGACALSLDGEVLCWGENPAEPMDPAVLGGPVRAIGAGYSLVGDEVVGHGDGYRFRPAGPADGAIELFAAKGSGVATICVVFEDVPEPHCGYDPRVPPVP